MDREPKRRQRLLKRAYVRWAPALGALILLTSTPGCLTEYDFSQPERELGTLGEEVHAIWLKDAKRARDNAPQKSAMLETRRAEFVQAVDTVAPADQLDEIDLFLQDSLVMIDDETLPGMTRKVEVAMIEASADDALLFAVSDASKPQPADFISPIAAPDLIGYVTTYPKLREMGIKGSRIVLDNDGFTDDGQPDPAESNGMTELTRTMATVLEDTDPDAIDDSLAIITRDMLLRQDERFAVEDATRPLYVAVYDSRGLPMATPDANADLFVDADGDGQPDLDADGNFILKTGGTTGAKPFEPGTLQQDAFGRTKGPNDTYAFEYVDLNKTGLGFLIREYATLSANDVIIDLLATFRAILGATVVLEDEHGPYRGFDPNNPLMDMSWGLVHALSYDSLPELLQANADFFDRNSDSMAGVVVSLEEAVDIAGNYPDAELAPTQTILFDLIPVLHEISSDPALWKDFMGALGDPITPKVGEAMVTLLDHRNTRANVEIMGAYDQCFMDCKASHDLGTIDRFECIRACPNGEIFQQKMDFTAPESPENRSQLQAVWHLMWSLTGVPYAMEMDRVVILGNDQPKPPALIALPGGAEAYLRSVAGNLTLSEAVPDEIFSGNELGPLLDLFNIDSEDISGVIEFLSQLFFPDIEYNGVQYKLSARPTPDELTRLFTQDDIIFQTDDGENILDIREPVDAEGYKLADNMADGLFEAEASGLIDAVYPMAKAFSDHDKEHLLLELFKVVHMHYPNDAELYRQANGNVSPSQAANLRSFEPIIRDVMISGRLLSALYKLSTTLEALEELHGVDFNEQLRRLVFHVTEPGKLTTRDGRDFINLPDGRTTYDLTPLHILTDAMGNLSDRVSEDPETKERFDRAVSALLDLALGAEWPEGGEARFTKDGSVALTISATEFLADRAREKRDAGELDAWLKQDFYTSLEELWPSRLVAGLVLIAEQLLEDPENRAVLDDFIAYMVGTPRGREHTTLMAYQLVVRSANTEVWVPIARSLSRMVDPDRDWNTGGKYTKMPMLSHGALMLHRLMLQDENEVGIRLINRGLLKTGTAQDAPMLVIGDVVASYFRADPSATSRFSIEDMRLILKRLAAWMSDDAKGLEQLYDLVDLRVKPGEE